MDFFSEKDLKARQVLEGITLKAAWGENAMMTIFDFEPGAEIPSHSHPHEQITYVVKGKMEFTLGGKTVILGEGDGVVVPAGVEHRARVRGGHAKAVDAWYPMREDYRV